MTVIKTDSNRVVADNREHDHTHVRVVWFGPPQDGRLRKVFNGPLMPIEDYQAAVDWALSMANQMVSPLYVVPYDGAQALQEPELKGALAGLHDQERGDHARHRQRQRHAQ